MKVKTFALTLALLTVSIAAAQSASAQTSGQALMAAWTLLPGRPRSCALAAAMTSIGHRRGVSASRMVGLTSPRPTTGALISRRGPDCLPAYGPAGGRNVLGAVSLRLPASLLRPPRGGRNGGSQPPPGALSSRPER